MSAQVLTVLMQAPATLSAIRIARLCGLSLEETYAELVALEAMGQAQVVVTFKGRRVADCQWKARMQ